MQVLALLGSPRKKGNTGIVLDTALAELKAAGAKVAKRFLASMDISGCAECFTCQQVAGRPGCVVKDDMQKVYRDLLKADLIVFATPVFCWGASAQLKAVMDRCYAMFKFQNESADYACLLEGKRTALIVTAGGPRDDGADLVEAAYRRFVKFGRLHHAGSLLACSLTTPEATAHDGKLAARARRLGQRLAKPRG